MPGIRHRREIARKEGNQEKVDMIHDRSRVIRQIEERAVEKIIDFPALARE